MVSKHGWNMGGQFDQIAIAAESSIGGNLPDFGVRVVVSGRAVLMHGINLVIYGQVSGYVVRAAPALRGEIPLP
ncbi:hypothetical protein JQX08_13465 [Pseudomonas sp. UL073]|uniref:Uncharacterized protein n=1 Tax=Zestomonas insulae TaxID=2809017 RepID=A0ABS2IIF7_9GAMM|nr:hypothetical protein [Pseudomonas insulae]MBM7061715.1 hypothetical protein [Pseudomonas insulae]